VPEPLAALDAALQTHGRHGIGDGDRFSIGLADERATFDTISPLLTISFCVEVRDSIMNEPAEKEPK